MKLLSILALTFSLCSFLSAIPDDYVLLKSFSLVPDDEYYRLRLLPISGDEISAAKFSMSKVRSEFLDDLPKSGKPLMLSARVVSINGKYKAYLPNGVLVGFNFQKQKKVVTVVQLAALSTTASVDHFIYEEPVSLEGQYFSHRNWSLSFGTSILTNEDYKVMALPNSAFYKVANDVLRYNSQNIELTDHSFVAFKLQGGHRFLSMTIDLERSVTVCTRHACSTVNYYAVSILAVDNTSKSREILSLYTKVDNHAYFIPAGVVIFFVILAFIVGTIMTITIEPFGGIDSQFIFCIGFFIVILPFSLVKFIIDSVYDRGPSKSERIRQ